MEYIKLIILLAGVYKCYGYCNLGHVFQPVSSEGTPCSSQNLDCIRIYFVNTWQCIKTEGLQPELANITEFTFPAASSNLSATAYDIEIKGIDTGRCVQIYNRTGNELMITKEWPRINILAKKVVIHTGVEDVTVTDFEIRFDYILIMGIFSGSDITISRFLKTNVEKVYQPVFQHSLFELTAEVLNNLFNVLLQDATLMIQKLFVVRSADFVEYLKANNICMPHGFLPTSDASICVPTKWRKRDILETNSTIPFK